MIEEAAYMSIIYFVMISEKRLREGFLKLATLFSSNLLFYIFLSLILFYKQLVFQSGYCLLNSFGPETKMCIKEKKIPAILWYLWVILPGKTWNNFYFLSESNFFLLLIINFGSRKLTDIFCLILAEHYSKAFNRLKPRFPPLFNYMRIFVPQNVFLGLK